MSYKSGYTFRDEAFNWWASLCVCVTCCLIHRTLLIQFMQLDLQADFSLASLAVCCHLPSFYNDWSLVSQNINCMAVDVFKSWIMSVVCLKRFGIPPRLHFEAETRVWRFVGSNRCTSSLIPFFLQPVAALTCLWTVHSHSENNWQQWIDRAAVSASSRIRRESAVKAPGCGENVWRSSPQGLRWQNIL